MSCRRVFEAGRPKDPLIPMPDASSRLLKKAFEYGQRAKSILIRRPQRKIDSTEYGNRIAVCAFAGAVCRLSDFFNSLLGGCLSGFRNPKRQHLFVTRHPP